MIITFFTILFFWHSFFGIAHVIEDYIHDSPLRSFFLNIIIYILYGIIIFQQVCILLN